MTPEEAIDLIDEILARVYELPDAGVDFGRSVQEKLESMAEWIDENQHVTPRQLKAIKNMGQGVERWLERKEERP